MYDFCNHLTCCDILLLSLDKFYLIKFLVNKIFGQKKFGFSHNTVNRLVHILTMDWVREKIIINRPLPQWYPEPVPAQWGTQHSTLFTNKMYENV